MRNILVLSSPYMLETLLQTIHLTNIFKNQKANKLYVLSEQYSGKRFKNIRVVDDINEVISQISEVMIINDGYFSEDSISKLKQYFHNKNVTIDIMNVNERTKNACQKELQPQLICQSPYFFENNKTTVLLLNLINSSQFLKLELLLTNELVGRNINFCLVTDSIIQTSESQVINIEPHQDHMGYLLSLFQTINMLNDNNLYRESDLLFVSVGTELAYNDHYSKYILNCVFELLKADYIVCCVPYNTNCVKLSKVMSDCYGVNVDYFFKSDFVINPDQHNNFLKAEPRTNRSWHTEISKMCDDVLLKLTSV